MSTAEGFPAILGGMPIRPQGPPLWPVADEAIQDALQQSINSGDWGRYQGHSNEQLVSSISKFLDVKHVVPCASGTAAVELALRGLKVGVGDEVILSAYDFKGNFQNILTLGAIPVLVDVDQKSWQISAEMIAQAVSSKTRAIIASHLHGGVAPMPEIVTFGRTAGIAVLEDACQMPGAIIAGKQAGTWGDIGVWSFGGSKLLSAGRGGVLFSQSDDIIQRVRLYTLRGNDAYPLSELQAAVVCPQLDQLNLKNTIRSRSVEFLKASLSDFTGLIPFDCTLVETSPGYYKLGFQYEPGKFGGMDRDLFAQAMRAEGIALDPGFRALHLIHSARRYKTTGSLVEAEHADRQVLTLHHPILGSQDPADLQQVSQAVARIHTHASQIVKSRKKQNPET